MVCPILRGTAPSIVRNGHVDIAVDEKLRDDSKAIGNGSRHRSVTRDTHLIDRVDCDGIAAQTGGINDEVTDYSSYDRRRCRICN